MNKPIIAITLGEPGGVGADICLDVPITNDYIPLLIGDINLLRQRAKLLNKTVKFRAVELEQIPKLGELQLLDELIVLNVECPIINTVGKLYSENAKYVLTLIDIAVDLCIKGIAVAMVTSPLSKENINNAGYKFSGHTEYLAEKLGINKVVMMLTNPLMKVALLTTHLPLKDVAANVTQENLNQTLKIIITSFNDFYKIKNPKIGVCGLNPHAGEGGYLGLEEIEIINPEISKWQDLGYNVSGAYPADTIFNRVNDFDVILAMYHDQGLPVLKYADFDNGLNITLGLPIIRVSVDHGTALSIAGTGLAINKSLLYAIEQVKILTNKGE